MTTIGPCFDSDLIDGTGMYIIFSSPQLQSVSLRMKVNQTMEWTKFLVIGSSKGYNMLLWTFRALGINFRSFFFYLEKQHASCWKSQVLVDGWYCFGNVYRDLENLKIAMLTSSNKKLSSQTPGTQIRQHGVLIVGFMLRKIGSF